MPGHHHGRGEHDARPGAGGRAARRGCRPRRCAAPAPPDAPARAAAPAPAARHEPRPRRRTATATGRYAPHRRREREQHDHREHDLARPGRRCAPSTTARTPRPTSPTSRPCRTARCTSPSTPPGSVALRNSDAVVVRRPRRRSGSRTPRPAATRHHRQAQHTVVSAPMPSAATSAPAVDQPQPVEERAGAQPPHQEGEDARPRRAPAPRPRPHRGTGRRAPAVRRACRVHGPGVPDAFSRQFARASRSHVLDHDRRVGRSATSRQPAARVPGAGAARSGRCSQAAPSQPRSHSAVSAASVRARAATGSAAHRRRTPCRRERRRPPRRRRPGRAASGRRPCGAGGR